MKLLICSLLLLGALNLQAAPIEQPENFCADTECTSEMLNISQKYATGTTAFVEKEISGYSGVCYHLNPSYYPEHAHHGAFVFEQSNKQVLTNGIFSFFYASNPFENMSTTELKQYLGNSFDPVSVAPGQVDLSYISSQANLHYWFRSSPDLKNLYVIGRDLSPSFINLIFCDMSAQR